MSEKKNAHPRLLQALPTGLTRIPVCIGDLPSSDYRVPADTLTFDVVKTMRDNEDIPGVMLFDGDSLVGAIPRLRMFERLGQLYGVDLFIRKPIRLLQKNLGTELYELFDHLRVNEAVQSALGRSRHTAYDPIIAVAEDGKKSLMDMHTLLLAQSQIIMYSKNAVSNLDRVERTLAKRHKLLEGISISIQALQESVPYHGAAVYLHLDRKLHLIVGSGISESLQKNESDKHIIKSATYQMMVHLRQAVAIEDVRTVPDWEYMSDLGSMRCWLGVPLYSGHNHFGLVSISRLTSTPFSKDEVDFAKAFTRLISIALQEEYQITDNKTISNSKIKLEAVTVNEKGRLII